MTPEQQTLVERIRVSARLLEQVVAAIPTNKQSVPLREGEWSVHRILLHSRDIVMLGYGTHIRRLVLETDPVFGRFSEDYRVRHPGEDESVEHIMFMIKSEHELLARLLEHLPAEDWQRSGISNGQRRNIEFWAMRVAGHAEEHAAQIGQMAV